MVFSRQSMALCRAAALGALLLAVAGSALAGGDELSEQVVGRLAGEPIYAAEVLPHLRPAPPRIGTEPPPDPRTLAFDAAVRVRLLAREARRREIPAPAASPQIVEAHLVRRVIDDELGARLRSGAPDEATLRAYYETHQLRLRPLESARISALAVDDAALAERLLAAAAKADDATFRRLVAEHSLDERSKADGGFLAQIDEDGAGLEAAVARVAIGLRQDGAVGLAQGLTGRYFVLRASEVHLEEQPWDEAMAARMRNLFLRQQRDEIIDALVDRLRRKVEIVVDREALDRLPVPTWDAYLLGS